MALVPGLGIEGDHVVVAVVTGDVALHEDPMMNESGELSIYSSYLTTLLKSHGRLHRSSADRTLQI